MPLFSCAHCEDYRQQRDRAQQELSHVLQELSTVTKEALAIKRHELGLPPAGFEPKDPLSQLGKKTRAAIEEMSRGYPDQNSYLTNWALTEVMKADEPGDDFDADLARRIYEGDTA